MKPSKLRHLMGQHGEVGRVYCAPEDPAARRARKAKGGNTGKLFTEGWVEFEDKKAAKQVLEIGLSRLERTLEPTVAWTL